MTTQNLPGTNAARHGTGDADLTIMIAAHDAFRRDLTRLARTASAANDPARRQSVQAGWELFKRELHIHHTAEDEIIWPALRPRLAHSPTALSVLDAMEAEHELIDPLLASVDAAFARQEPAADVIDALTSALTGHLAHEERDGLPLIGVVLTAPEWRGVGRKMASKNGLSAGWRCSPGSWTAPTATTAKPPWPSFRPRSASSTAPAGSPASRKPTAGKPQPPALTGPMEHRTAYNRPDGTSGRLAAGRRAAIPGLVGLQGLAGLLRHKGAAAAARRSVVGALSNGR